MTIFNRLFGLIPTSILVLVLLATPAVSVDLRENVDAALAARGFVQPGQIGKLTKIQRAQALNKMMTLEAEFMQQPGVFGSGRLRLDLVQNKAFGSRGWEIQKGALEVARAGLKKMHMAEEVKAWLESGNSDKIKMAQAVLELPASGILDPKTFRQAKAYIQAGYETDINKLDFVRNVAGGINPTMFYRAAAEGRIYVPDVTTDEGVAELKAAGIADDLITAMKYLPSANDPGVDSTTPGVTSREEFLATEYMSNRAVYTEVIKIRNRAALNNKLVISVSRADVNKLIAEMGNAAFANNRSRVFQLSDQLINLQMMSDGSALTKTELARAYSHRGWAQSFFGANQKMLEAAIKDYIKGNELAPDMYFGLSRLAFLLQLEEVRNKFPNGIADSVKFASKAIDKRPDRSFNYWLRAQAFEKLGKYELALLDVEIALKYIDQYPSKKRKVMADAMKEFKEKILSR